MKIINNNMKKIIKYFYIILLIFLIKYFFIQFFFIISSSMSPNLNVGDFVLVYKFKYKINNIINYWNKNNKLFNRGDIIAFKYPINDKIFYIKRIVGLPNDILLYNFKKKTIFILNNDINNNFLYKDINKKYTNNNYFLKNELIKKKKYNLLINKYKSDNIILYKNFIKKNINSIIWYIPSDSYFVMGDNRDNSFDSRYWGFVKSKYILGLVKFKLFNININNKYLFKININKI